jgi:hypothetical protein
MNTKLNIPIAIHGTLNNSVWNFDRPFLRPGDRAVIVEEIVAHPTNPLYLVERSDGKTMAIHRQLLIEADTEFYPKD